MSIITPIGNGIKATNRWFSRLPYVQNTVCSKFQDPKANSAWIAGLGVTSIVLKDGFGCYLYVNQSLNNKEIPEDKRKFVAALDLANGGLMILLQVLMTYTISKKVFQEKMFNKLFGKLFNRQASKSAQAIMESREHLTGKVKGNQEFHKAFADYRDSAITALGTLTTLIAATTVGKRILTPFIATPLADKTKEWMSRNDKPVHIHKDTRNTYDTTISAEEKAEQLKQNQQVAQQTNNLLQKAIVNDKNK